LEFTCVNVKGTRTHEYLRQCEIALKLLINQRMWTIVCIKFDLYHFFTHFMCDCRCRWQWFRGEFWRGRRVGWL